MGKSPMLNAIQQYEQVIRDNPGYVPAYLALGRMCLERGEVDNALSHYRVAAEKDPNCGEAWVMLGWAYRAKENYRESETCCRKGVSLLPQSAYAKAQLAETLGVQGLHREAVLAYRAALDINSQDPSTWSQLCRLYAQMEEYSNVEMCCREVIARVQGVADPYVNLGIALQEQNKLSDAESAYKDALKINPDLDNAQLNLMVVQYRLGKLDIATESARRISERGVNPAALLYQVSTNLLQEGKLAESLYCGFGLLKSDPDNQGYRRNFMRMLDVVRPGHVSALMREEVERSYATESLDSSILTAPCLTLLKGDPDVTGLIRAANSGDIERIRKGIVAGKYDAVFQDPMLLKLLQQTVITSWEFEILFGVLRDIYLDIATADTRQETDKCLGGNISFLCALACNFFNTEYVSLVSDRERSLQKGLIADVVESVKANRSIDAVVLARLAICCMYTPLSRLGLPAKLVDRLQDTQNASIKTLIKAQWLDHMEEKSTREQIQKLTPVQTTVSCSVREQYEASPYPRWKNVDVYPPLTVNDFMQYLFASYEPGDQDVDMPEVLIAGCGTGRQAIMTASILARCNMLAIDLSLSSLAYGMRKARELGVDNITFAQADILEFRSGRKFHIIESAGVLHHLAEPETGLKILANHLETDGLLRIGLYSDMARRSVTKAKEYIREKGYGASSDEIRLARKDIQNLGDDHPARGVVHAADFFSLSECRDLLFHAQERNYRLHEISAMLDRCGLECIGFESPGMEVTARYNARFPDDPMRASFANWNEFETMYPDTFAGMYMFWCRKTG